MRDPLFLSQLGFVAGTVGLVVAVLVHKTAHDPRFPAAALLLARGVLPAIVGLAWATGYLGDVATVWAGRIAGLLILLALLVALLTVRSKDRASFRPGRALILAALAFSALALLSEFATGEVGGATPYTLAAFLALWLGLMPSAWLLQQLKAVLALFVIGSALVAVLGAFAWTPYDASLIGLDSRLHGLMPHANGLGPIMLLYLIAEYIQPSRRWVRWSLAATAATLLVLTQSKTAWAAAIVVGLVLWAGRSRRGAATRLVAAGMIGVTCVALIALTGNATEYEVAAAEQVESLRTLTGRTALWDYGLQTWRSAPVFGGGSSVFRDYAERTGQPWAGQAHNQYVQTLGRHGLLGLVGLLMYLGALIVYGLRLRHETGHGSLALVAVLLVRTFTESNLDSFGLEQLVVFGMLLAWERDRGISPIGQVDRPPSRASGSISA